MYNLNLTSNQAFWTQVLVWKDYGGIKKKKIRREISANNVTGNTNSTWHHELKGIVHSKIQIIYSSCSKPELLSKEHKNIFKNVGIQAEFGYHWWPLYGEKHLNIFDYFFPLMEQHEGEKILHDRIVIFGCTIPLRLVIVKNVLDSLLPQYSELDHRKWY